MMRKDQAEAITKAIGTADGLELIDKLNSLGAGEDIEVTDIYISIPKTVVKNIIKLQSELSTLSKTGRSFEITEKEERVIINTTKMQPSYKETKAYQEASFYLSQFFKLFQSTRQISSGQQKIYPLGISEERFELPPIPRRSKVLDVGAGTGFIAKKIKDTLECDVYALEPNFERSTDSETCVQRLGEDHVEKLTLQEALQSKPEKYFQAFDVVTVFKYNVPYEDRDEFFNSLAKTVKPGGTVFITSVESERIDDATSEMYLIKTMQQYFSNTTFEERRSSYGIDYLTTCTHPEPVLEMKIVPKKQ